MTIKTRTTSGQRKSAGLCLGAVVVVLEVVVLSGCGGGDTAVQQPALTVTTTPTVTVTPARATPTAAATTGSPKSDVAGRKFDLGTVVRVKDEGGVPVIILNRWSARDVRDTTVAAKGLTLRVHSDAPYVDRNADVTYRIPVAPGATFTYAHCISIDQPARRESSTLKEFTRLQDPENLVLLTLDRRGRATRARNDPAC